MKFDEKNLLLYVVTDRSWTQCESLNDQVEMAIHGGATMVQLREKELDEEQFYQEARELKKLCEKYHVPFLINDRADIAQAVDADGVHVGQKDKNAAEVRRLIGRNKILGVSVQTMEQALQARKDGADYLGVGAVFHTDTKADADFVTPEVLHEICMESGLPVVAIGGITEKNVEMLSESGIAGIAVISAVFSQPDIEKAATMLRSKSERVIKHENGTDNCRE
jgi:thiamine-phosphate pyrophosphorylase